MSKKNISNKKKRKKQQKKQKKKNIKEYRRKIKNFNNSIWLPTNLKYTTLNNNTWFEIKEATSDKQNKFKHKYDKPDYSTNLIKCKKVIIDLNKKQHNIMQCWLNAYSLMFNETLRFIKKAYLNKEKISYNFKILRTHYLKHIRDDIIKKSGSNGEQAKAHNLDYAIKTACANYKSCLTNYKRGNIRHFRIRYWRHNRQIKVMDIERQYFKDRGLCYSIFGSINYTYNGKKYDIKEIKSTCKISYNTLTNQYILFVPEKFKATKHNVDNKVIALDPGIRTFMTGISENKVVQIGNDTSNHIKPYLKRLDRIKGLDIPNKIKKKVEKICYRKITGLVDELHWKTINYLTNRFENILIGDMSIKGISNKSTSKLSKMTKRIGYSLRFYQFKQRLEYKCQTKKLNYIHVNESYTSKTCSKCGNYDEYLGGKKVYDCKKCKTKIDRDVNGARGILIKSL